MNLLTLLDRLALTLLALALVPVVLALCWRAWHRARIVRLLGRIPGPPALPIIGSLRPLLRARREDMFSTQNEITMQYLPIMCFWKGTQGEVHLTRSEDVEVILTSSTHIQKSHVYDFVRSWLGNGLLTSTGNTWHAHRKFITPTFHFRILESFLDVFVEKSQILAEVLEKELNKAEGFDVYPYVTLCALDIICETAMGTQIDAQRHAHSEYVKAIYEVTEGFLYRVLRPWLYPDFIYFLSKKGREFQRKVSILHDFANKIIEERKSAFAQRKEIYDEKEEDNAIGARRRLAFLDLLLAASRDGTGLSDEEIREEVDTFMFAGHDTTSAGICWTLFLLGAHQDVQEKAVDELEAIFQGSDRSPTMQDLAEMKYLERVIKESMRLYPSVPSISRRLNQDVQIGKYTVPAGANAVVRIFLMHRDPRYFPNPEKFDPDNFLPERVQGRHPYAYIPFSAGPRNCLGQRFALLEEKTVLCALLRRYAVEAVHREEELRLVSDIILRPSQGIRLRLQRRCTQERAES